MLSAELGILIAAEDLVITHEEARSVIMGVLGSAVMGMALVYAISAFGKGLGLNRKEVMEYVKEVEEI